MFEKEAEEYANGKGHEHYNYLFEENAGSPATFANWCFKDGAEFGYKKGQSDQLVHKQYQLNQLRKANEWHYVKDGDLPKGKGAILIYWKFGDVKCASVVEPYKVTEDKHIIAWKKIVLPKEIKENE